jgi:hypothetical protein
MKLPFQLSQGLTTMSVPCVTEMTELGLLNNVGTAKTMGTLRDQLNAFPIMKWT